MEINQVDCILLINLLPYVPQWITTFPKVINAANIAYNFIAFGSTTAFLSHLMPDWEHSKSTECGDYDRVHPENTKPHFKPLYIMGYQDHETPKNPDPLTKKRIEQFYDA